MTDRVHPRGASTVEFALSMLVFIPLALYGAFAGEVFQAGFRAQEAEQSAGWDITAYKMHNYEKKFPGDDMVDDPPPSDGDELPTYGALVDQAFQITVADRPRYNLAAEVAAKGVRDDLLARGLATQRGAAGTVKMEAGPDGLKCELLPVPSWDPAATTFGAVPASALMYLHRGGYVGCSAQVHFVNDVLTRDYATEFAKEKLFRPNAFDLKLCGMGTGVQGCKGRRYHGFVVLTNDWALDNPAPHRGAGSDVGPKNPEYWNVGASIHSAFAGPGLATRMIRSTMAFFAEDDLDFGSADPKAYGNGSSSFKLNYRGLSPQPLGQHPETRGGPLRGPQNAHTTPQDDVEPAEAKFTAGQTMGATRANDRYLGQRDPNYNSGWSAGQ